MMNITYTNTIELDEMYLRDACIDAIHDFIEDDFNIIFTEDISSDMRRLIYAKVGALLIDYAGSEEFK